MRVIAGSAKGRKLIAPKGRDVRPTSDRVKEALFNIIGAEVEGAVVLDLYCGSGALGIEALSRGAERASFVDSSPASVELTKKNLELTRLAEKAKVHTASTLPWLRRYATALSPIGVDRFDLVFLDPPYALSKSELSEVLALLGTTSLAKDDAMIILERSSKQEPPRPKELELIDERRYGDTTLSFYAKPRGQNVKK